MRSVLVVLSISLYASVCLGQIDSSKTLQEPLTTTRVPIPGVDTPLSGPGTMLQSTPQPAVVIPENGRKNRKARTVPPSDPSALGVGLPIGKAKKDSLR